MDRTTQTKHYFDIVRNVFLRARGANHARALYAVGGAARNEDTSDLRNGKLHVYNDLDFLVVLRRRTPQALLRMHRIQQILNDGRFDFQVDLIIQSAKEMRSPAHTIQNFDIQNHHVWLWGDRFLERESLPRLEPDQISRSDAVQLLLNRQASLLIGILECMKQKPDRDYIQVQLCKPLFAMMAALQIAEGEYQVLVADQLRWICDEKSNHSGEGMWQAFEDDRIVSLLQEAVAFKHKPTPAHFGALDQALELVAQAYHSFLMAYMIHHYELPPESGFEDVVATFRKRQPLQIDLLSPGWWACWLRTKPGDRVARFPRWAEHPQVSVYACHLNWLRTHVLEGQEEGGQTVSRESEAPLEALIRAWKVSGYGCRIR